MSNRDPDAHYESLGQWFDYAALEWAKTYLHTVMPGIVESYDAEKKRAAVQPAINLLLTDGTTRAKPLIQNVPVAQTSGGGFLIQVPLKKGDAVLLFFSERGMDKFKETFEVADPLPNAFFDIRDAIAMPGFGAMEVTPVTTTGLSIQTEDGETYFRMEQNGTIDLQNPNMSLEVGEQGGVSLVSQGSSVRVQSQGSVTLEGSSESLVVR